MQAKLKIKKTRIKGLYIITPQPFSDTRGNFVRVFCRKELGRAGIDFEIKQISRSLNKRKGTIRGMHFQGPPKAEAKIIQCLRGAIYDVAIDLRKNSPTLGQWLAEELSAENGKMFYLPKGFAHGFETLTADCEVLYLMSEFYSPEYSSGIRYNDPFLKIKWPIKKPFLSEKDKNWPLLAINK